MTIRINVPDTNKPVIEIDFETRSRAELKDCGVERYSEDESTEVLCLAIRYNENDYDLWMPSDKEEFYDKDLMNFPLGGGNVFTSNQPLPPKLKEHLESGGLIEAHNAAFEISMWSNIMVPKYGWPVNENWSCSMAKCAASGIPQSLSGACEALGLDDELKKDKEGKKIMQKMCKPRKTTKKDPSEYHLNKESFSKLCEYCLQDTKAESAVSSKTIPLKPKELEVWAWTLNQNFHGMPVDIDLIDRAIMCLAYFEDQVTAQLTKDLEGGFDGRNTGCRGQVLSYLFSLGYKLEGYGADDIEEALKDVFIKDHPKAEKLLRARQILSKSSVSKFHKLGYMTCKDGTIKGGLNYHGAITGRFAGRGVQFQNLPRQDYDLIQKIPDAIEAVLKCDVKTILEIDKDPYKVISNLVRSAIYTDPAKGKYFIDADFSNIEARVSLWMAGDDNISIFTESDADPSKPDIYETMAAEALDKPACYITKDERNSIGKPAILGLGFQMGVDRFTSLLDAQGVSLPGSITTLDIVASYRKKFHKVKSYWYALNRASLLAMSPAYKDNKNKEGEIEAVIVNCGKVSFRYSHKHQCLQCVLPSRRPINYPFAEIRDEKSKFDKTETVQNLYYKTSKNGQFVFTSTYGGKLFENVVQATARDIMVEAGLRLELSGFKILTTIHDEFLCLAKDEGERAEVEKKFLEVMKEVPTWAQGCPIEGDLWIDNRFRK